MFYNATQSFAATNVMTSVMVVNLTASSIAVLATASRQLWAFARNKGVPFSTFFAPASTFMSSKRANTNNSSLFYRMIFQ